MTAHKCPVCGGRFSADVHLDGESGVLSWASGFVVLIGQQKTLMMLLLSSPSKFARYERMELALWGYEDGPENTKNSMKVVMHRLSRTLRKANAPVTFYTIYGVGAGITLEGTKSDVVLLPSQSSISELLD